MAKIKKKLTTTQKRARKAAKAERQKKYEWVFMNGKQVKIKRYPTIDGIDVDEFIENNADPIWLHQNGMWEHIDIDEKQLSCKEDNEEIPSKITRIQAINATPCDLFISTPVIWQNTSHGFL
ncbi:hypothetical protein [Methyloprofundus sedimenti]|uniref:hypothetical protein n=1 Tax=Methyloprofundus sedimenti TaxID=1420851 RepID=UPI0018E9107C|nr:hypothetical protein [Methyloprofundus sedimenti]